MLEERAHRAVDVPLQERFAAGDLHELAPVRPDLDTTSSTDTLLPFVKRVRCVAPGAAQVARGQADEHARPPGVRRLSLDGMKDLVDRQHRARGTSHFSSRWIMCGDHADCLCCRARGHADDSR